MKSERQFHLPPISSNEGSSTYHIQKPMLGGSRLGDCFRDLAAMTLNITSMPNPRARLDISSGWKCISLANRRPNPVLWRSWTYWTSTGLPSKCLNQLRFNPVRILSCSTLNKRTWDSNWFSCARALMPRTAAYQALCPAPVSGHLTSCTEAPPGTLQCSGVQAP